MQLVVEKIPLLFIIYKIINIQIASNNQKKMPLKSQKTPNIPNESFWEQDPWYGHQMYIRGPNNPKSTHVAEYKDIKKQDIFYLGIGFE